MPSKITGSNQSIAREINNQVVLDEIKNKESSATELAKKLKLSNATLSSILNNLLQFGIIRVSHNDSINGLGRKRVVYELNDDFALGLIVSITNFSVKLVISNIHKTTLYEETFDVEEYNLNTMYKIIINIKDILTKKEFRDIPVGDIIISLPGLINKQSGELQVSPQFNPDLFDNANSFTKLFEEAFKCPVYLENDTKLMMLGELANGAFKEDSTGMLIYNDIGMGGALEVNGKLFLGSRGYAGEIGLLEVLNDKGELALLDNVASLRALKSIILEKYQLKLSTKELIESYKMGNSIIVDEVLKSGTKLGEALSNAIKVFDIDSFIISGRCVNFGQNYLEKIREQILQANKEATVSFSQCCKDKIIEGAKDIVTNYILKQSLENIGK